MMSKLTLHLKTLGLSPEYLLPNGLDLVNAASVDWTLDLSFLERSDLQLNELIVRFHVRTGVPIVFDLYASDVRNAFQTEVVRVGESQVGLDGLVSITTTPYRFDPLGLATYNYEVLQEPLVLEYKVSKKTD
jgi:hypothetical protein